MISSRRHRKAYLQRQFKKLIRKYPFLESLTFSRELYVLAFFCFLFFVVVIRLLYLQIAQSDYYDLVLSSNHFNSSSLKAQRGHIYVTDKWGKEVKLTENITLYTVHVDPKFLRDIDRFIDIITPIVYKHLCVQYGIQQQSKEDCVKAVGEYTRTDLLPEEPEFFYYSSWIVSSGYDSYDWFAYNGQIDSVVSWFTQEIAQEMIRDRLAERIKTWYRESNYLWFFDNQWLLSDLQSLNAPYLEIEWENYVSIVPTAIGNSSRAVRELTAILTKHGFTHLVEYLPDLVEQKEYRYIKLFSDANPAIADEIGLLKQEFYTEQNKERVPLLHGVWLSETIKRYYPYEGFMSHMIGYMGKDEKAYYGVEEYYDELLRWSDGILSWRSSAWIGQIGANDFHITEVDHGDDVWLTIDPSMQKEIELIAQEYHEYLQADSVSVIVYDPYSGHLKSSVSYPSFNPNRYGDAYELQPLDPAHAYIVDDETQFDVPVFISSSGQIRTATSDERLDSMLQKYIATNIYGPQVFVDKNIASPYEPGSIFKTITYAIGIDVDEISDKAYDLYDDPDGYVKVWPYTIANIEDECTGTHSFLYALTYSCNVWMVRIAQKVSKHIFYNYLEKLGFGSLTHIELAGEDEWFVEPVGSVSLARFLNNTYGQWLLATPLQVAVWYGTIVNGWYYVQPTIIDKICDGNTGECESHISRIEWQVFKPEVATSVRNSLFTVLEENEWLWQFTKVEWYTLGWKSWTSEISFKGKYRGDTWRTNGSFVWIVTKNDLKYVIVVQVRRPRLVKRWGATAWRVFREVADFLIGYELLDS